MKGGVEWHWNKRTGWMRKGEEGWVPGDGPEVEKERESERGKWKRFVLDRLEVVKKLFRFDLRIGLRRRS